MFVRTMAIVMALIACAAPGACADDAPWARYVAALSAEQKEPPRAFVDPAERLGVIYGGADEAERERMREALAARLAGEADDRARTGLLNRLRAQLPPEATVALAWSAITGTGDWSGPRLFLRYCTENPELRGPAMTEAVARVARTIEPDDLVWLGGFAAEARAECAAILRNGGPEGQAALKSLGWTLGEADYLADDDPERHRLLMAQYDDIAATHGTFSEDILIELAAGSQAYPEVRDLLREKISPELTFDAPSIGLIRMTRLLRAVERSRDSYFEDALEDAGALIGNKARYEQWRSGLPSPPSPEAVREFEWAVSDAWRAIRPPIPEIAFPRGLTVAALIDCRGDPDLREAAALELAARVAAGDAHVAAEVTDALEAHFRASDPERLRHSVGMARIILPPDDRIDLLMRIFAADTSPDGAVQFAFALKDSADLCGAPLFERRDVFAAMDKVAGERSGEFRVSVSCAMALSGPLGRRASTTLGWDKWARGSGCFDPSLDAKIAESWIRHYETISPEEPMARVRELGRLADRVTDFGLVRDYLRTELPPHFELADHPEGPSALAHAALAAVETGDVYFVAALRAAAETMRAADATSLRTPPPGIEGGWDAALANLAAKLDAAAERFEVLAEAAP